MSLLHRAARTLNQKLDRIEPIDLAILLTLALILVRPGPGDPWYLAISTTILGIAGLLWRDFARQAWFWFVLGAIFFGVNNVERWAVSDNHKFLTSYWCLAVAICLCVRDREEALATTGRLLIGLVFLFATIWKITSNDYLTGETFHFLLISDVRFFPLAYLFCDFPPELCYANQQALEASLGSLSPTIPLQGTDAMPGFATFLTWFTVAIEGIIAVLFLIPPQQPLAKWRDAVLLSFVVVTYPPTNVIHFGWVLIAMAVAQCPKEHRGTRLAYVVSFLFIFCFSTGLFRQNLYDWLTGL